METILIPKNEYFAMKQEIADLQAKINFLQDADFMNKLSFFINLFYRDYLLENKIETNMPFEFGIAKDFIFISDDFNESMEEFNEYL